jgi:hypothetical protein
MATKVCFMTADTCHTGAETTTGSLVDYSQVADTGRKPEAVRKSSRSSDNLLSVTLDVRRNDQYKMAALRPIMTVVFTAGGPVVYERASAQFA